MSNERFNQIPASACMLVVGEFELGDNGEGAKSAPIRLVARSGQPIEHWFWGRVVHDLAGMHLHKPRLPVDYAHDAKEVIGYLNKFDIETGDLITSGALVPFKDTDRASEIMHKMSAGVPYEASINFGGDGMKIQEIMDGEVAEVNGYQFDGPGIIVREWPLRGVAICPYGADMNTESTTLSNNKQVFSASVISDPGTGTEEIAMSESVEVTAPVEAPVVEEPIQVTEESPVEEAPAEELEAPAAESVEAPAAEGPIEPEQFSVAEFSRITDEFGPAIAAQTVREKGDYSTALKLHSVELASENVTLKARVAELEAHKAGTPAQVSDKAPVVSLFKTGK